MFMDSKSSSRHEEDASQGSNNRGKVLDEIQREVEEELENSERILNSAGNSFGGSPRKPSYCSKVASKNSSREGSGRATREASPALRSGMESMGHGSCEPSRVESRFTSEINCQGIPTAFYFENYLKTGSPLPNCPDDVTSSPSRLTHLGVSNVHFDEIVKIFKPLNTSSDSCTQQLFCAVKKNQQISSKKKSFGINDTAKKSFDNGSCRASFNLRTKSLGVASAISTCSTDTSSSRKCYTRHSCIEKPSNMNSQLKIKSSLAKKTCYPQLKQSKASIKMRGFTPRMSKELNVCALTKRNYCDRQRTTFRRCVIDERRPSDLSKVCQITERFDCCATPLLDPCLEQPQVVLLPAPLRDKRKTAEAEKSSELLQSPQRRQGAFPKTSKAGFKPEMRGVQDPTMQQTGRQVPARGVNQTGGNLTRAEEGLSDKLKAGSVFPPGSKFPAAGSTVTGGPTVLKKAIQGFENSEQFKTTKTERFRGVNDAEKYKFPGAEGIGRSNERGITFGGVGGRVNGEDSKGKGERSGGVGGTGARVNGEDSKGKVERSGDGAGGGGRSLGGFEINGKDFKDVRKGTASRNDFADFHRPDYGMVGGVSGQGGTGRFGGTSGIQDDDGRFGGVEGESYGGGKRGGFEGIKNIPGEKGYSGAGGNRSGFMGFNDVSGGIQSGGAFRGVDSAGYVGGGKGNVGFRDTNDYAEGGIGSVRGKEIGFKGVYGAETTGRGNEDGFRDDYSISNSRMEMERAKEMGYKGAYGAYARENIGPRKEDGFRNPYEVLEVSEINKKIGRKGESFRSISESINNYDLAGETVDFEGFRAMDGGRAKEGNYIYSGRVAEISGGMRGKSDFGAPGDFDEIDGDVRSTIKSTRFYEMEKGLDRIMPGGYDSQNQASSRPISRNLEFQNFDDGTNQFLPFNISLNDQVAYNMGRNEPDLYSRRTPEELGLMHGKIKGTDVIGFSDEANKLLGPSHFAEQFGDKYSTKHPLVLGAREHSGVGGGSLSKGLTTQVTWADKSNQLFGQGKNISIHNEPSSGQGNTGVSSPYQGSKLSGRSQIFGSPSHFASDSKSSSKCAAASSKSHRQICEDSDAIPDSLQFSKSHSHYTSSPTHMSECINSIHGNHTSGSKSSNQCPEFSCRLSSGTGNFNDFEESGYHSTSTGRASEKTIKRSDDFRPLSRSSYPVSECPTQRFSQPSARCSQNFGQLSPRSPEQVSGSYVGSNELDGRMSQYPDVSGEFSQRSPRDYSECAAQVGESSDRIYPSSIRFVESSASHSEFATQFSENASHFSKTSNRFNVSSARLMESSGRMTEPLGTIPESPSDPYGLPLPSLGRYSSRSGEVKDSRGPNVCSERAIRCLTRLNAPPQENRANRGWDEDNLCQFLTTCDPNHKAIKRERKLPKKPELSQNELQMLINDEANDVDLTRCIVADDRKSYKKPCPKQMKAKMQIKQLIHSIDAPVDPCPKDYGRLIEPDPEDISPDVAAAMMFSQEQGIKMESCPADTIKHLFPDEKSICEKTPMGKLSFVDASQGDQDEMIEKSASLPTDGLSDSTYTRLKKQQSEDVGSKTSYESDFEAGQGKREFVLVSQKSQRFNKIQYRGNDPSWFPGYFSAFPDDKGIKVVSSPSTVFNKAWMATNPGTMPLSDVTVIE